MSEFLYLDTSFVAPFYVPEATSEAVEAFLGSMPPGSLMVSRWTEVEFASLLARDVRMKNMAREAARRIMDLFTEDVGRLYREVTPTERDFQMAMRLLLPSTGDLTMLRGPDALHLCTAKHQGATLYTLDRSLLRAAQALGVPASDAGIGTP